MSFIDILGAPSFLTSIFGYSATDIWTVAQGPMHVYHFDGNTFTQVTDPDTSFIGSSLGNVWGPTSGIIYCVVEVTGLGPFPPGRLKKSVDGGTTWTNVNLPNANDHVHYVFGFGNTDLYIVVNGASGVASSDIWHSTDDGASWTKILNGAVDPPGIFYMLAGGQPTLGGTGPNDLWAIADGMIGHYDGVTWTFYNTVVDQHTWFNIVTLGGGELFLGSLDGNIMHITGNGASRVLTTPLPYAGTFCVFGTANGIYAVEAFDNANFKVQKRTDDATWNYVVTQPGSNATVGYSPDGIAAVVVGLTTSQKQDGTPAAKWTDTVWPPLQFPAASNPTNIGETPRITGNWLQAVEVHAQTSQQNFTPTPPPPLGNPNNIVPPNITQDQINVQFRIVSPRPGQADPENPEAPQPIPVPPPPPNFNP